MVPKSEQVTPRQLLPDIGKPSDKYKYEQRIEKELREKERMAVVRDINRHE